MQRAWANTSHVIAWYRLELKGGRWAGTHVSLQRGMSGPGELSSHWARLEIWSTKGNTPPPPTPVALPPTKRSIRATLQVADSSLGQALAFQGVFWKCQLLACSKCLVWSLAVSLGSARTAACSMESWIEVWCLPEGWAEPLTPATSGSDTWRSNHSYSRSHSGPSLQRAKSNNLREYSGERILSQG